MAAASPGITQSGFSSTAASSSGTRTATMTALISVGVRPSFIA